MPKPLSNTTPLSLHPGAYPQERISTTPLYGAAPGTARDKLRGFYSAGHERTLTSNVRSVNEYGDDMKPIKPRSFIVTKSHMPMKRDRVSRRIK